MVLDMFLTGLLRVKCSAGYKDIRELWITDRELRTFFRWGLLCIFAPVIKHRVMQVKYAILQLFLQLEVMLEKLSDDEYNASIETLSGSSIGQHFRHVLECFQELGKGYHRGFVNYDLRKRDRNLETSRRFALRQMALIGDTLERPEKQLVLAMAAGEDDGIDVPTSYYRELVHNLDHTVHHMALMRIGVSAVSAIQLPEEFGVAYATIKYRANNSFSN